MADRLRKTYPLKITFSSGEQPTSAKLSAISEQTRNGLTLVEYAVGDVWNHSGDSLLHTVPLQLPNLARMLGQNQYFNPAIYPLEETIKFKEFIGTKFANDVTGYLTYKPKTGGDMDIYDQPGDVTGTAGSNQTDEYLVGRTAEEYDYFISDDNGKFRVNFPLTDPATYCIYEIEPSADWFIDYEAFPGVIPDIRQEEFTSCRLEKNGTRYFLHLPPRRPLNFSSVQFDKPECEPQKYPASEDIADVYNFADDTALPYRMWQSDGVNALAHQHYRYSLPKELRDAWSGMSPGDDYPTGILYLWDKDTDTIIDGIVFSKPAVVYTGDSWVIEISSDAVDLDTYVSSPDDETEASYNDTDLVLITCGTPAARSIWHLFTAMMNHGHNNEGHHTSTISHEDLANVDPPVATGNPHSSEYPSHLPRWPASAWMYDDHVSLLSRGGSQGSEDDTRRDENDNAMLGHLVLADQDDGGTGIFLDDTPENTWRLYFGAVGGPSIYATTGDGIVVSERLYMGGSSNGFLEDDSGSVRIETPAETVLILKTDGESSYWGFDIRDQADALDGSLTIGETGEWPSIYVTPPSTLGGTIWMTKGSNGSPHSGLSIPDVVVKGTNSMLMLLSGADEQTHLCMQARVGGSTWVSSSDRFGGLSASYDRTAWLELVGNEGVRLRYGQGDGTIGAYLDDVGDFYCNNDLDVTNGIDCGGDLNGGGAITCDGILRVGETLGAGANYLYFGPSGTNDWAMGLGSSYDSWFLYDRSGNSRINIANGATGLVNITGPVVLNPETTSPTRAAIRLTPQDTDTDPSSASKGDVYVNSTTGLMSAHNGSGWKRVWHLVHVKTNGYESIQNASTYTPFPGAQFTIPANTLRPGTVLRLRAAGKINAYDTNNRADLGWHINGTLMQNNVQTNVGLDNWVSDCHIVVETAEPSGLLHGHISTIFGNGVNGQDEGCTSWNVDFSVSTTSDIIVDLRLKGSIGGDVDSSLVWFSVEQAG